MIKVSREERDIIKSEYPDAYVGRTMRQDSKRQHFWATLDGRVVKILAKARNVTMVEIYRSEDAQ